MADATCSIQDCERPAAKRGWCLMHYARWQRHGDPRILLRRRATGTPEQRFWTKVQKTETCWLWIGARYSNGYGNFFVAMRQPVLAHRYAYELLAGPIPAGLTLDHLCRVRHCVNPAHLEPVTHRENVLRGDGWSGRNARKTHCPAGHPYTDENTRIERKNQRKCRICEGERQRSRRRKQNAHE